MYWKVGKKSLSIWSQLLCVGFIILILFLSPLLSSNKPSPLPSPRSHLWKKMASLQLLSLHVTLSA